MQPNQKTLLKKKAQIEEQLLKIDRDYDLSVLEDKQKEELERRQERRDNIIAKESLLKDFAKDFPQCSTFIRQLKYFEVRKNKWNEAKKEKDLDYTTKEAPLIRSISKQYTLCVKLLFDDLSNGIIKFRRDLMAWQKKVDTRLTKLEKG